MTVHNVLLQATLTLLDAVVTEAQLLGQAAACSDTLQALDASSLMQLLSQGFVSSLDTAYGTRVAALHLLASLFACVRQTWSADEAAKQPGSVWDSAVVACLAGIVRHVCMPNHDTRLGGMRGKQLLRLALRSLQELVIVVPEHMWTEEWQQVCTQHERSVHAEDLALAGSAVVYVAQKFAGLVVCHRNPNFRNIRICLHQSRTAWWLNGRASDSRSEGCVFDSRPGQKVFLVSSWMPLYRHACNLWYCVTAVGPEFVAAFKRINAQHCKHHSSIL